MKRLFRIFLAALAVAGTFSLNSCNNDDDDSPSNIISVDGKKVQITQLLFWPWGGSNGEYNTEFSLVTSGINTPDVDDWTGTGTEIYFDVYHTNSDLVGTFTYDARTTTYDTFDDCSEYSYNYDFSADSGSWYDINGGTINIKRDGDYYIINLDVTEENGKRITGTCKLIPRIKAHIE